LEILLVEDNPVDVMITRDALYAGNLCHNLHVAEDGEEAMDFLYKRGRFASVPSPEIVLLDLNLPRKDGREVLADMKNDPELQHIPVIVLTTSASEEDIRTSYELHANCFITKPSDVDQFRRVIELLGTFWSTMVKLPIK